MRKSLLASIVIIFPSFLFSQITLTEADFADSDDTIRMSTAIDPAIDFASTGPNYIWDFSSLFPESQFLDEYYNMSNASTFVNFLFGAFAPSNYQASYFLPSTDIPLDQIGQFLPVNITDVFQFTRKTADSITSIGFSLDIDGNEVPFKSDTIETRYKFPINYGNIDSTRGYSNMDMNPFVDAAWIQYRQKTVEVDGWGTVTTPYGTFDALRLKHFVEEIDSLKIPFGGSSYWVQLPIPDSYIYEWWTNGQKEAVLRIETNVIAGTEVVSNIEYRDVYLGLDASVKEMSNLDLQIYPNPVVDEIHVNGLLREFTYKILDQSGKVIIESSAEQVIDASMLTKGNYILWITTEQGSYLSGFIKQ